MEEGGSIILTFILGIKICWAEQVVFYGSEEVGGAYPATLYCSIFHPSHSLCTINNSGSIN